MAGPYDYTVNIPQPPANNFLQSLLGIQQLKGLRQQQELSQQQAGIQAQQAQFAQQEQPLREQQLQAQIAASQASAAGQSVLTAANQLTLDQRRQVGSALDAFNKNPETGVLELAKVAPYMDSNAREGIGKAIQFQIGKQIDDTLASGKEVTPEQYQKFSNSLNLVPTNEQQQARNAILSMPQNLQTSTKAGVVGITNAALNGNRDAAISASDEAATALNNSGHPAAQATARLFDRMTNQLKDETVDLRRIPISALNLSALVQDKDFHTTLLNTLKENAVMQKGEVEKSLPSAIIKDNLAIEKVVDSLNENAAKMSDAAAQLRAMPSKNAAQEWWTNTAPKLGFGENPEITTRNTAAQLAGLSTLGQESKAIGGVVRSNVMFNYATQKIPDAWNSPQALADRLDAQAEVQRRNAKLAGINSEWNSLFRQPRATRPETIMGIEVAPGTSISDFKKTAAELLFPKDEQLPAGMTPMGKTEPVTRKKAGLPPAANSIFRTTIGGKSITVEPE